MAFQVSQVQKPHNIFFLIPKIDLVPFCRSSLLIEKYYNIKQRRNNEGTSPSAKKDSITPDSTLAQVWKTLKKEMYQVKTLNCKRSTRVHVHFLLETLQLEDCRKYLFYDYDPELFETFLKSCDMKLKQVIDLLPYAVNHDSNIRRVIEQGLAFLDYENDLKSSKDAQNPAEGLENGSGDAPN